MRFKSSPIPLFIRLKWDYEIDKNIAISLSSSEFTQLSEWTAEIGIDLLFGFIEISEDTLYSSCAILSNGTLLHLYRRISKGWKEFWHTDSHYQEGDSTKLFSYRDKNCLIALCGDLWDYPERFCQEADLLFWPVFVNFSVEEWITNELADYIQQANTVCSDVLFVNSIVNGDEPAFGGCYHFVNGNVKEALPMGEEGLLIVNI